MTSTSALRTFETTTRGSRLGSPLHNLVGSAFDEACAALMQMTSADYSPTLLIGIRYGGFVVAEAMARSAPTPAPTVQALTSKRATTKVKSRLPLLRAMLLALPVTARDLLRRVEHRYFIAARLHAPRAQIVDRAEAMAIQQHLRACTEPQRILVVDDAVDSGVTLEAVLNVVHEIVPPGTEVRSAVITQTLDRPCVLPDYTLFHGTLCRFPWSFDAAA